MMNVNALAERLGAALVTHGRSEAAPVTRVYAGDRMSDLLNAVSDGALLVTHLSNPGVARLVELMDAPAICFVSGAVPDEALVAAAQEHGTALLVSPHGMFETCGRLYEALQGT